MIASSLIAGALLGEVITPNLALGAVLVLIGIALVNGVLKLPARAEATRGG
jgi:drug/metabolite transporter (DMT)-like permease